MKRVTAEFSFMNGETANPKTCNFKLHNGEFDWITEIKHPAHWDSSFWQLPKDDVVVIRMVDKLAKKHSAPDWVYSDKNYNLSIAMDF